MKTNRPKLRRVARAALWFSAALIILILLLPLWFPLVLRPILKQQGLRYSNYQRMGLRRFAIETVRGEWKQTTFTAKQIECELPDVWVWQKLIPAKHPAPQLIIRDGTLRVSKSTNEVTSAEQSSSSETLATIQQVGVALNRMLSSAQLTNCVVEVESNQFAIPQARLENGTLHATVLNATVSGANEIVADITAREMDFSLANSLRQIELEGKFTRQASGWKLDGDAIWLTNRAALSAQFGAKSWWPERARIAAPELRVPAKFIGAKGYEDLRAALEVDIVSNQFALQATGFALPASAPENKNLPPVQASLRAQGSPDSAVLTQLQILTPWLNAQLTNEIGMTRAGRLLGNGARLQLAINLDKFPGSAFHGRADGFVAIEATTIQHAAAQFHFAGAAIRAFGFDIATNNLSGDFDWPMMNIRELSAIATDGSALRASGSFNIAAKEISNCQWRVEGKALQRLVKKLNYDRLTASGELHGAISNIFHSGSAAFENIHFDQTRLANAQITWRGENLNLSSAKIEASSGGAGFAASGNLDVREIARRKISGAIQNASLRRTNQPLFSLDRPFTFRFRETTNRNKSRWSLRLGESRWSGADKTFSLFADVDWPDRGAVRVTATNLSPRDFSSFAKTGFENFTLEQLNAEARWSNGPVRSTISIAASSDDPIGGHLSLNAAATLGETLVITNLSLANPFAPALVANGDIPVQVVPGRTNGWLVADDRRAIHFEADWQAVGRKFFLPLGLWGKLEISNPQLQARASGTLAEPGARLVMNAASIDWQGETNMPARPRLDDLDVNFEMDHEAIALRRFAANLDGQPIRAWGDYPLPPGFWKNVLQRKKPPDWTQARGELEIEQARVAALARYMPAVLAPEGFVNLNVSLAPGGKFDGLLLLTNAATRPIGEFTPLRNIAARVRLNGSEAVLENFQGEIGGEPVRATGRVTVPLRGPLDYEVNLQGRTVPLARSVEILLRGDMNVQLRGGHTNSSVLSGTIRLHDGLYLQHASSLLWSGPKRTELRPPYFSVTNAPFADWKLNLAIQGNKFLRVRTPVFSGTVSANLAVTGTLRDPVVTGDGRVDSGRILFPFGTLNVEQGFASLTGADPRGPDILLNASGRNFDYDVRLEVRGPADGADVTFSSTPPLNSDEILLMLTAGELPQNTYTFSAAARAGRLATFLGRDIFSRFSGDSGEERLIITTGENISEEGKLTYSVEYRFTPRWSVVGEYDRFGAVNAEVKWKLFSR